MWDRSKGWMIGVEDKNVLKERKAGNRIRMEARKAQKKRGIRREERNFKGKKKGMNIE